MSAKIYTLCLGCGNVQVRSDIVTSFTSKPYVFLDKKSICPKCHKISQYIATKDIKQLKKTLVNSTNVTDQKIRNYIRG